MYTISTISTSMVFLYLGNMWFAVVKKSLAASTHDMQQSMNLSTSDLGEFSASFSICYGLFKLVGGLLTDIFPVTTLFALGLLLGSLMNLIIPMLQSLNWIKICWSINGLVQGGGGPALSKIALDLFPAEQRAFRWSNLLTVSNLGYLLAPYFLMYPLYTLGWKGPFLFAGVVGVTISVGMLLFPLKSTATTKSNDIHSNTIKTSTNENQTALSATFESDSSLSIVFLRTLLALSLVLANTLTYMIVKVISDWTVQYLMYSKTEMDYASAIMVGFWCEIGGITGQSMSGALAKGKELLVSLLFTLLSLGGCLLAMLYAHSLYLTPTYALGTTSLWTYLCNSLLSLFNSSTPRSTTDLMRYSQSYNVLCWSVCFFIVGYGINGPKSLLQLKATEECILAYQSILQKLPGQLRQERSRTGTVSGIVGLFAQLGASCSGLFISSYLQFSYEFFWPSLALLCGSLALILLICVAMERRIGRRKLKVE